MKKLIFSLLLYVIVSQHYLNAQSFVCTHTLTPEQRNEIIDRQNNAEVRDATCLDTEWTGEDQTYKVVLEYSTVYTDPNDPDEPDYMTALVTAMQDFYEPYGIILDILILPNELDLIDPTVDGWAVNSIDDCITGKIVNSADPDTGGAGVTTGSNFWVKDDPSPNGAIHELGHALGLFHTQGPINRLFDITDNANNEVILFDQDEDGISEYTDCEFCNFEASGDWVADTPVDPIIYSNTPEAAAWRAAMFDYEVEVLDDDGMVIDIVQEIKNTGAKTDKCGNNYADMSPEDQYKVFNNVMGQHANYMEIDPFLSWGQVERIKRNNLGKSWTVDGSGGMMVACEGFTVDSPMVIDTDKLITSDVIVNDKLTILNANVKFSAGVEIILNEGAQLIIDNSNLDTDACVSGGLWSGIRIVGDQETTRVKITNQSTIKGIEESAITCNNAELLLDVNNGSTINCLGFNVIDANDSNLAMRINQTPGSPARVTLEGNIILNNINGWLDAENANFNSGNVTIPNIVSRFDNCQFSQYYVTLNNSSGFHNAYFLNNTIFTAQSYLNVESLNGLLTIRNSSITEGMTLGNVNDLDIGLSEIRNFNLEFTNETANENQNVLVRNRFVSNSEAIKITGQNNDGLSIDCNRFLTFGNPNPSALDISIQSGSIAEFQGGPEIAAGNKFNNSDINIFGHDAANVNYFYLPIEEPIVSGILIEKEEVMGTNSKCGIPYPYFPYPPQCYDGIQNGNETGVDCGGSCNSCPILVTTIGPPLIPAAYYNCNNNGIQDNGESGVDCGGGSCPPCSMFVSPCYDGIQNNGETDVDCGGACDPCVFVYNFDGPINNQNQQAIQNTQTEFVTAISDLYGEDIIELGDDIDINVDIQQLNALLDNGNTEQLVVFINDNSTFNNASVINTLNSISPYVSAEAIHSLFNHIDDYAELDVFNVLLNNPGLLNDSYIKYMVYESGRLNSNQIDQIKIAHNVTNDRTLLEEKIRIKRMYMYYLIRERISLEMSGHNPTWGAIRAQLLKKDHRDALYQIYETFISENNYSFATQYLDIFDPESIQIPFYKTQLSSFKELNQILLQYYYGNNRTTSIPPTALDQMNIWANGCFGKTTIKSKAILKELFNSAFGNNNVCSPYQTIDKSNNRSAPLVKQPSVSDGLFTLSPNPATNSIDIRTNIVLNSEDVYILTIYNTLGNKIHQLNMKSSTLTVDLTNFEAGVYMYQIAKENVLIHSDKFIKVN